MINSKMFTWLKEILKAFVSGIIVFALVMLLSSKNIGIALLVSIMITYLLIGGIIRKTAKSQFAVMNFYQLSVKISFASFLISILEIMFLCFKETNFLSISVLTWPLLTSAAIIFFSSIFSASTLFEHQR